MISCCIYRGDWWHWWSYIITVSSCSTHGYPCWVMLVHRYNNFLGAFCHLSPGCNDILSTVSMTSIPSLADNGDINDSDGNNNHNLGTNRPSLHLFGCHSIVAPNHSWGHSSKCFLPLQRRSPYCWCSPTCPSMCWRTSECSTGVDVCYQILHPTCLHAGVCLRWCLLPIPGSASMVTPLCNLSQVSCLPIAVPCYVIIESTFLSSPVMSPFPRW